MTTRWRPDFDPTHLYFITTTTVNRFHIFQRDIIKRIVADALYFVSLMNQVSLYAFVIMPNHIHVIVQCSQACYPKDWVRVLKTSVARLIVRQYQVENNQAALDILASMVTRPDKQRYKVWEDEYSVKDVITPSFLRQKLVYLHNNPLQPHWQLANVAEEYGWSSACYYLKDKSAIIPVKDVGELLW